LQGALAKGKLGANPRVRASRSVRRTPGSNRIVAITGCF
jgi:hypothetical protein